jgi:hypothetical protein
VTYDEAEALFYKRWLDCAQPPGAVPWGRYHEEPPVGMSAAVATWESAQKILADIWKRYPSRGERQAQHLDSWFGPGTTAELEAGLATQSANGTQGGSTPEVAQASEAAFWASRLVLTHVRDVALARRCSPWAVLGVVLARVVAATPPRVVLPPLVGSVASLNLFVGLVGRSGDGKGAAVAVGTEAVDLGALGLLGGTVAFAVHTPGSGQGIGHAYAQYEKGVGMARYADSALFELAEIDHLVGLSGQTGSTLMPELRRLYMGERLGHLYVDVHKRVEIEAHSYRASFVAGVQPARSGVLLDDADGGTPQRWMWLPVTYPHADQRPSEPAKPWRWQAPEWIADKRPSTELAAPAYPPQLPVKPEGTQDAYVPGQPLQPVMPTATRSRVTLSVPECAATAIDVAHLARSRGVGDPLDGHRLLCQLKVAAALGILDGRPEVSRSDWELAEVVMAVSDATRKAAVATLRTKDVDRNVARANHEALRAVVVDTAKEQAAVTRAAQSVQRVVARADGWIPRKDLRNKINSTDKANLDAALDLLIAAGEVIMEPTERGAKYRHKANPA